MLRLVEVDDTSISSIGIFRFAFHSQGQNLTDRYVRFPRETVGAMGQDGLMTAILPTTSMPIHRDHERCYRAVSSRDARFDGVFFTGVRTTGIYCRPSCPARTPKRANVSFYATAAAA